MKLPQGISCASSCVKFSTVLHFDARNLHEIFLAHENGASFWCKFLACRPMSSALIVSSPCYSNLATTKLGCTVSNYQLPLCPTLTVCTTTLCCVFVLDSTSVHATVWQWLLRKYRYRSIDIDTFSEKYRYRYRRYFWKVSLTTLQTRHV